MDKRRLQRELLTKNGSINSNIIRNNPDSSILKDICDSTSFLDDGAPYSQRVYCIMNDIKTKPSCSSPNCNNPVKFHGNKKGYSQFCSSKCRANDVTQQKLREDTIKEKYGVANVFQNEDIKRKSANTIKEKYGVDNIMKLDEYKNTVDYSGVESSIIIDYVERGMSLNKLTSKWNIGKPKLNEILKSNGIEIRPHSYISDKARCVLNDRDQLQKMYTEYSSTQPIAAELGVTKQCVLKYLKKHEIEIVKSWDLTKYYSQDQYTLLNDPEWMEAQYKLYGATTISNELDVCVETVLNYLRKHGIKIRPGTKISAEEHKLVQFIKSNYEGEIVTNTKEIIPPFELDIYLPELKLAIEVNGIYWHSEIAGKKNRQYHQNKYEMCRRIGVELIQLWDHEINDNFEVISSFISNKLRVSKRVYARKCEILPVGLDEEKTFLNECHLQGYKSSKYAYGLYHDSTLVAIMTFGSPRFLGSLPYDYELLRFAVKRGYSVVGGASKLLKAFSNEVGKCVIISYSDCRYSQGNLYKTLGFSLQATSDPIYYYTKDYKKLENRMAYQKSKIKSKFPDQYDPNLTEWQNMQNLGYDRVWACKTYTWVKTI